MRWVALVGLVGIGACKRDPTIVKDDTSDTNGGGDVELGDPCAETSECVGNLVCSSELVCARFDDFGTLSLGQTCDFSDECRAGLVCDHAEQCAAPGGTGTSGIGDGCTGPESCQAGLSCYEGTCQGFEIPFWDGVACRSYQVDTDEPPVPYQVHVELAGDPASDFFLLPFPNDIRATGPNGVSLAGFTGPVPGRQFGPAGDVPADMIAAYDDSFAGFGGNQAVYFRLSELPIFDNLIGTFPEQNGTFGVFDITAGDPFYGTRHPVGYQISTRQRYACDVWLGIYPAPGTPFLPGHTYAAVLTTSVFAPGPTPDAPIAPLQSPDLAMLLGPAPADGGLQATWQTYAPLRTWMAEETVDPSTIAGATVFTVEDVRTAGQRVRDAVRGSALPEATQVHHCVGTPGPHASALDATRGCFAENGLFREIQGLVTVPVFQQGTKPYKVVADGGAATWTAGQPLVLGAEPVTFAMTVPTGVMPASGWPVVLFAHDGGGNYRSFVEDGMASLLSAVQQPDGNGSTGFVMISFDTWLTGPRAGVRDPAWASYPGSYESNLLYDSPLNPVAARDNRLQSAGEWFQIVRLLEGLDWTGGASPTGTPIAFDLEKVYFMGHGIGGSAGPLFAAWEPRVKGAVFAGSGAGWLESLSGVTRPFAYDALVGPAIADGAVNRFHPLLNLGQGIVDRTDASSHAAYLHYLGGGPNRDVLQVFGQNDGWVGDNAQYALARGLYADQVVMPGATALSLIDEATAPVTQNVVGATAVVVVATGNEPHRLIFDDTRTRLQVAGFLATAVRDGRATLPAIP